MYFFTGVTEKWLLNWVETGILTAVKILTQEGWVREADLLSGASGEEAESKQ